MSPDLIFWLALAAKMAVTATLVVIASVIAERSGALIGAMVATLPISAGPSYIFLSLDHDADFIAASALASLTGNVANALFCTAYTLVAQSRGMIASLTIAVAIWTAASFLFRSLDWTLSGALLLNLVAFAACLPLVRRFRDTPMPLARKRWYDIPVRAGSVTALVAFVVTASSQLGPTATGILTMFPIVLIALILIFQPRIGGAATATITANGIFGLAGYGFALLALHLLAVPAGEPAALLLALAISVGWNLMILRLRRARV